jgi:hypothetical protein
MKTTIQDLFPDQVDLLEKFTLKEYAELKDVNIDEVIKDVVVGVKPSAADKIFTLPFLFNPETKHLIPVFIFNENDELCRHLLSIEVDHYIDMGYVAK